MLAVLMAERDQHVELTVTVQVTRPVNREVRLVARHHQRRVVRGAGSSSVKQLLSPAIMGEGDHRIAIVRLFGVPDESGSAACSPTTPLHACCLQM
jgi:hypothetical protein